MRDWLPLVLQYVTPWLSERDIAAGERWSSEVGKELEETNFGILCLTSENLSAPWLLFEAGALSKIIDTGAVCPYLLNVDVADITGPLSQFQAKKADRGGTFDLLKAINARAAQPLDSTRLMQVFDGWWPSLQDQIARIPILSERNPSREPSEILEELVTVVRGLEHRFRNLEDNLQRHDNKMPSMSRPRHSRSSITIRAQGDFKHFKNGDTISYHGNDLIDLLQKILLLPSEDFGEKWHLRDEEGNHFLTLEEARDPWAYFGNRESRIVVLTTAPVLPQQYQA